MAGEEKQPKFMLPKRQSQRRTIFLPKKELSTKYPAEMFEAFGDVYYQTQINNDPVAKEFILSLFNRIGRDYVTALNHAKSQPTSPPNYPSLARIAVQLAFPDYNEPLDPKGTPTNPQLSEAIIRERDTIAGIAGAQLGDVIAKGACVCLEQSIILNAILGEKGYFSWIGAGVFSAGAGHAWVGYLQDSGEPMMADAVWGFNMPYKAGLERYQKEAGPFRALQSRFLSRR